MSVLKAAMIVMTLMDIAQIVWWVTLTSVNLNRPTKIIIFLSLVSIVLVIWVLIWFHWQLNSGQLQFQFVSILMSVMDPVPWHTIVFYMQFVEIVQEWSQAGQLSASWNLTQGGRDETQ